MSNIVIKSSDGVDVVMQHRPHLTLAMRSFYLRALEKYEQSGAQSFPDFILCDAELLKECIAVTYAGSYNIDWQNDVALEDAATLVAGFFLIISRYMIKNQNAKLKSSSPSRKKRTSRNRSKPATVTNTKRGRGR